MRLLVLFATALVLLCGAQAVAENMTAVPADRIRDVKLPAGVVMTRDPVIDDGKVIIYVDDDKTNWTQVLLKAAARDMLDATLTVTAPAGAVAGTRENLGDAEMLTAISQGTVPDWFSECSPEPLAQGSLDGAPQCSRKSGSDSPHSSLSPSLPSARARCSHGEAATGRSSMNMCSGKSITAIRTHARSRCLC